jgi:hypothetical protein
VKCSQRRDFVVGQLGQLAASTGFSRRLDLLGTRGVGIAVKTYRVQHLFTSHFV